MNHPNARNNTESFYMLQIPLAIDYLLRLIFRFVNLYMEFWKRWYHDFLIIQIAQKDFHWEVSSFVPPWFSSFQILITKSEERIMTSRKVGSRKKISKGHWKLCLQFEWQKYACHKWNRFMRLYQLVFLIIYLHHD